jgi:hypothetical protein
LKILWFLALALLMIGAVLAFVAVAHDYIIGSKTKSIGDSQLGSFFIALAITLFGAFLLQFLANQELKGRIRELETVHKNIKAGQIKGIKMLFGPIGLLGALAGLGIMTALVLKDYSPMFNFGIGPSQELAIFGGSILSIVGISFMTTGNTFLSAAMGPIILQFEGLTQDEAEVKPQRKVRAIKQPVKGPEPVEAPVALPTQTPAPIIQPSPEPEPTKVEAPVVSVAEPSSPPVVEAPEPVLAEVKEPPTLEPLTDDKPDATWSDTKAEEMALVALKEAEAELGLQEMQAQVESDLVEAPEKPVEEVPCSTPPSQDVVEVFECPNCHKNVAETDTMCPHCGVSFEGDELEEEAIEAVVELEEEKAPPAPEPPVPKSSPTLPPRLPPPLPPPLPSKKTRAKVKTPDLLDEIEMAPPTQLETKNASTAPTKADDDDTENSGQPSVLQSILDEITKTEDAGTKAEEPEPIDDGATEVPRTCPNCGRKIKPRWKSCPYCGLEFH